MKVSIDHEKLASIMQCSYEQGFASAGNVILDLSKISLPEEVTTKLAKMIEDKVKRIVEEDK